MIHHPIPGFLQQLLSFSRTWLYRSLALHYLHLTFSYVPVDSAWSLHGDMKRDPKVPTDRLTTRDKRDKLSASPQASEEMTLIKVQSYVYAAPLHAIAQLVYNERHVQVALLVSVAVVLGQFDQRVLLNSCS